VPGVYVPRFYDMAADGSVHPNRPDVPARVLRRVATPMPLRHWFSALCGNRARSPHGGNSPGLHAGLSLLPTGYAHPPGPRCGAEAVVDAIEKGMRKTGYNEFSLLSLSCSDYLALPAVGLEVKNRLKDDNISLSLPSQRVDRFDENIANILGGTRQTGPTFAPEAGTQRMRDIINKGSDQRRTAARG
jgi:hypothetical protein